jgi:hypothetical protein
MSVEDEVLVSLAQDLDRRLGSSIQVLRQGKALLIQRENDDNSVCVSVANSARPSFNISYPKFDSDAQSWRDLQQAEATEVLSVAVVALVRSFAKDGAVLPEFPSAALRRGIARGRKC